MSSVNMAAVEPTRAMADSVAADTEAQALAAGEILPSDGQAMSGLIEAQRRAYETHELAKRLEAIEEAINKKDAR